MRNRRRRQLIDSSVQGRLARRLVLHWAVFFTIVFFALPLWRVMNQPSFSNSFTALMVESWAETMPVFLFLLALIPIFIWDTITLSNRFAGPMYRLHSAIRGLIAGEPFRPVKFRTGDFWHEVAADFNTMVERLSERQAVDQDDEEESLCAASSAD